MFFSEFVLTKKGAYAKIWLAAHWEKKLTKQQITETNIKESVDGITKPSVEISLRTSGHLLLGVVKIYSRKVKYTLAEVNEALTKIKLQVTKGDREVNLPEKNLTANFASITFSEKENLQLLLPNVNTSSQTRGFLQEISGEHNLYMADIKNITIDDEFEDWNTAKSTDSQTWTPLGRTGDPKITDSLRVEQVRRQSLPGLQDGDSILREIFADEDALLNSSKISDMEPLAEIPSFLETPGRPSLGGPQEIIPFTPISSGYSDQPLTPAKKKRKVSSGSGVIIDEFIVNSHAQIRAQLRDTSDLKRRRKTAPKTKEELKSSFSNPLEIGKEHVDKLFKRPMGSAFVKLPKSTGDLFMSLYEKTTKKSRKDLLEIETRRDQDVLKERIDESLPIMDPDMSRISEIDKSTVSDLDFQEQMPIPFEEDHSKISLAEPSPFKTPLKKKEEEEESDEDDYEGDSEEVKKKKRAIKVLVKKYKQKGLTERTVKVLAFINQSKQKSGKEEVGLKDILTGVRKKTAAKSFFEVLVLKSKDMLTVEQEEPFGEIKLGNVTNTPGV